MAHIVAGLFEDQVAADKAIKGLRGQDVGEGELATFVVSPPGMHHGLPLGGDEPADHEAKGGEGGAMKGAALGGVVGVAAGLLAMPLVGPAGIAAGIGAGAFVGALAGATQSMGDEAATSNAPAARPGGVMVAVSTGAVTEQAIVEQMRSAGAKLVESAEGAWNEGAWSDFDPVRPPQTVLHSEGYANPAG